MDQGTSDATQAPSTPAQSVEVKAPERAQTEVKTKSDGAEKPKTALRESIRSRLNADSVKKVSAPPVAASAAQVAAPEPVKHTPVLAPNGMSESLRTKFQTADPELQQWISQRAHEVQSDYTKKTMQLAEERRENRALSEATKPHRERLGRKGIAMDQAVSRALAWDEYFEKDKHNAAREFLAAWNVDPEELIGLGEPQQQQAQPQITQEEIDRRVQERVEKIFQEREGVATTERLRNEVEKFKASKPIFRDPGTAAQIERAMFPLVQAYRASDPSASEAEILDKAFRITMSEPQFAGLNQRLNAQSEAERQGAEAAKALQASRSISGAPGGSTPKVKHKDLRSNIRANLRG